VGHKITTQSINQRRCTNCVRYFAPFLSGSVATGRGIAAPRRTYRLIVPRCSSVVPSVRRSVRLSAVRDCLAWCKSRSHFAANGSFVYCVSVVDNFVANLRSARRRFISSRLPSEQLPPPPPQRRSLRYQSIRDGARVNVSCLGCCYTS